MSIFSVSSEKYGSIVAESKARKLQKEQEQGIKFENVLANNQKTADLAQNLQRLELPKDTQQNIYSVKFKDKNELGYTTDEQGFMGDDFNKTAGLPNDFKIHKSTIDEFMKFAKQNNINNTLFSNISGKFFDNDVFENIDIANTIGQYYNVFSQIVGQNLDKEYFNQNDLINLPKGYISSGMQSINFNADLKDEKNIDFLNNRSNEVVTNIFKSKDELDKALSLNQNIKKLGLKPNLKELNFLNLEQSNLDNFNPELSYYKTENGYKKEALFISFLKSENPAILEGGNTALKPQVIANNIYIAAQTKEHRNNISDEITDLQKISKDKESFKSLVLELLKNNAIKINDDDINLAHSSLNEIYNLGRV